MSSILTEIPGNGAARYESSRIAINYYADADAAAEPITWNEFNEQVTAMANALAAAGLKPGDKVALLSSNSAAMLTTDFGAYANGIVTVSIYATASAEQI